MIEENNVNNSDNAACSDACDAGDVRGDAQTCDLLPGKKYAPKSLGRVLVLGLGVTGRAVAKYLVDLIGTRVDALSVMTGEAGDADAEDEAWAQQIRSCGAEVLFDRQTVDDSLNFDLCIASPGISQFCDFYQSAARASTELISEVEFAWRESDADACWIAITGTNGKTTTTALCAHLLCEAGVGAQAVGNIGDACIEAVSTNPTQIYVAEVSSFQLASTKFFAPNIAVVLNITPDHLSWHKSHENYASAKWKILDNMGSIEHALAIFDATNDEVRAKVREIKAIPQQSRGYDYVPIGTAQGIHGDMRQACGSVNAAFVDDAGVLRIALRGNEYELINVNDLRIKGTHNISNALAGACAALACGVDAHDVSCGLASFEPVEHRMEFAGEIDGVACYNDSKATNVDAVLAALAGFEPQRPLILLGGHDKGTDLDPLVEACAQHASAVICFGEAGERFFAAFDAAWGSAGNDTGSTGENSGAPSAAAYSGDRSDTGSTGKDSGAPSAGASSDASSDAPSTDEDRRCNPRVLLRANHLEDAFDAALDIARSGDIILLSPACSSFDEFENFEDRGDYFKHLVQQRADHSL